MAEISVKQLKFRGLGIEQRLDVADKLPGTEASASVNVTVPKNAAFSVHQSIFTTVVFFGEPLAAVAELSMEGVSFAVATERGATLHPRSRSRRLNSSPYVSTPATSQKPLEFNIQLKNHLPSEFRGLLRVRGQTLETGREIRLSPNATETANIVVRTALPLSTQAQAQAQERSMSVTVDLPNPKEPIHKRVVPLVYAEAIVVSGRKGRIHSELRSNSSARARRSRR